MLAQIALRAGAAILDRNRAIARDNLHLLDSFFAAHADRFDWIRPDGGVTAYPQYRGAEGVEAFATELITRSGVLVLPASVYRSDVLVAPENRFRIGFGRRDMPAALAALQGHLK